MGSSAHSVTYFTIQVIINEELIPYMKLQETYCTAVACADSLAHNPGTHNGHHKPWALMNVKLRIFSKPQVKFQTKREMS